MFEYWADHPPEHIALKSLENVTLAVNGIKPKAIEEDVQNEFSPEQLMMALEGTLTGK